MSRARIGLALGGGSARGWSHVGVIDALHEAGLEPDIVCGTSMGALVGAAYVTGRLPVLKDWACALTWRGVASLIDVHLAGGGLVDGDKVVELLVGLGITAPIEQTEKPFAAVATSLINGREIWLRTGPIADAVRASISLPGIFRPMRHGDDWLVDGGLVNPVPVSVCRALGAEVVIAVNLSTDLLGRRFEVSEAPQGNAKGPPAPRELIDRLLEHTPEAWRDQAAQIASHLLPAHTPTPAYFDVLANCLNIMEDQITRARLAGEPPHVVVAPRLGHIGPFEFFRAAEAIEEGRVRVQQALPHLRQYL